MNSTKGFIIPILAMVIAVGAAGYFGPWWGPAASLVIFNVLLGWNSKKSALFSGLILAVLYLGISLMMYTRDEAKIIHKTGALLGGMSALAMALVTVLTGAISGALAGWTGSVLGSMIRSSTASVVK